MQGIEMLGLYLLIYQRLKECFKFQSQILWEMEVQIAREEEEEAEFEICFI